MPPKTIVAFDAYGTLLSTESIAKKLSSHFGSDKAQVIATSWRKYQLEYTWRLNSMTFQDQYEPFSKITHYSLQHALAESSVSLSDSDTSDLMEAYNSLSTFEDVGPALKALESKSDIHAVVFSNGTHDMVSSSVHSSPDLKPYASVFKEIVTVEKPKKFKPAPEVYFHLAESVDLEKSQMDRIWLVSGNPFDIVGARAVGMRAAWVDRSGNGWQDALVPGEIGRPTVICSSLVEVVEKIEKFKE